MTRVPLLVIGGYLGAGKTTLILHLLRHNAGRRLLVLVNDFGEINIDADLIAASDGDSVALTNGCVCCALRGDLYYAIGDALDQDPRPDMIVVEASGVSEPARIAAVARAEPDLDYTGVVTVVDAEAFADLREDALIGPQVVRQVAQADLVVLSKTDRVAPDRATRAVRDITAAPLVEAVNGQVDSDILLGIEPSDRAARETDHARMFDTWSGTMNSAVSLARLEVFLAGLPDNLYRLKGWFTTPQGAIEVQRVGLRLDRRPIRGRTGCRVVAISPSGQIDPGKLQLAWDTLSR